MDLEKKNIELNLSKENQIVLEMKSFEESLLLLSTNYYELNNHFEHFRKTFLRTFHKDHPTKNINIETKRLIHNYLCSVITLIYHSRVYINKLHPKNDFEEYQTKLESTFLNVPLCSFVKEFRQYIQHYKLPEISFQKNTMSIGKYASMSIKKEELLKFSGWKKNSKQFINSSSQSIDLRCVLKEYQTIVISFYDWLLKRQKEIFENEILKVNELKKEIILLKLKIIEENIINSNYKTLKDCEKDLFNIMSKENYQKIQKLNEFEKITEIIKILKADDMTKYILEQRLESIII